MGADTPAVAFLVAAALVALWLLKDLVLEELDRIEGQRIAERIFLRNEDVLSNRRKK